MYVCMYEGLHFSYTLICMDTLHFSEIPCVKPSVNKRQSRDSPRGGPCSLTTFKLVPSLLLGCLWQTQSRSSFSLFVLFFLFILFFIFYFLFFSVSAKVLPVTPLVSGVFVHRAFCAYFLRIERVVELRRFLWWTQ